jgi:Flp pilus assembly protein TadG
VVLAPKLRRCSSESAQSLIETALVLPLFLMLTFNTVNFGYFFFVAVNLASAPRQGVEYSIQGFATPNQLSLPNAGPETTVTSVSWLTYQDMAGLYQSSNAKVRVCTKLLGLSAPGTANCTSFGGSTAFSGPDADPEPTSFVLHRVDVQYTVTPLIPGGLFNLVIPNLTFHRQVSMRAMD